MSCIQVTACQVAVKLKDGYPSGCVSRSHAHFSQAYVNFSKTSLALVSCVSKSRQHGPVCVFSDKEKPGNTDEGSPWKALEKAMDKFKKETSIEDLLKQQIAKKEYYEDGSNIGGDPPGGDGGDGGGGGGFGESEEEGSVWDEVLQVTLATLGFVFLYIYIIDGEDITRIAKDIIKYMFGGKKTIRLGRLMDEWSGYFQRLKEKKEVDDFWLERAIFSTETCYDSPEKYRRILLERLESRSD